MGDCPQSHKEITLWQFLYVSMDWVKLSPSYDLGRLLMVYIVKSETILMMLISVSMGIYRFESISNRDHIIGNNDKAPLYDEKLLYVRHIISFLSVYTGKVNIRILTERLITHPNIMWNIMETILNAIVTFKIRAPTNPRKPLVRIIFTYNSFSTLFCPLLVKVSISLISFSE